MKTTTGKWKRGLTLGEGGQGQTYLAESNDLLKPGLFVYKRLKNISRLPRFRAEVDALSKLSHPGIVKLIDWQLDGKEPYLVMEYCEKGDLASLNLTGFGLRERLVLFGEICAAVAVAHQSGIIHRDLKPKNILVRGDGSLAVGDFGLCLHASEEERFTHIGEAVGPRDYIAPELEGGGPEIEPLPSCDCYSLGKLLYFMLTGRTVPRERHREGTYNILSAGSDPGLHFAYELLDASICEDPEKRFKGGTEFSTAVDMTINAMDKRAHVLDLEVPQPCIFCKDGTYVLQLHTDLLRTGSHSSNSVRNSHRFWGQNHMDDKPWMMLVCDFCGNVQVFRPDFIAKGDGWRKLGR